MTVLRPSLTQLSSRCFLISKIHEIKTHCCRPFLCVFICNYSKIKLLSISRVQRGSQYIFSTLRKIFLGLGLLCTKIFYTSSRYFKGNLCMYTMKERVISGMFWGFLVSFFSFWVPKNRRFQTYCYQTVYTSQHLYGYCFLFDIQIRGFVFLTWNHCGTF